MKRVIVIILIILFIVNFIPIKFAKKNIANTNIIYCKTEPKLSNVYKWIAYVDNNHSLNHDLLFELKGKEPNSYLSKLFFDVDLWHKVGHSFPTYGLDNTFAIYFNNDIEEIVRTQIVYANDWDIMYPIRRAGLRQYISPKSYLTIYDFNWFKSLKELTRGDNGAQ